MSIKSFFILLCLIGCLPSVFASQREENTYPFTSSKNAERFYSLTKEIRCVVCQNQNIADSYAPLANDLREKIYLMILEEKSNDEIKTYLVNRYGEFILLKPSFNKLTFLLWLFPFLALALSFWIWVRYNSVIPRN